MIVQPSVAQLLRLPLQRGEFAFQRKDGGGARSAVGDAGAGQSLRDVGRIGGPLRRVLLARGVVVARVRQADDALAGGLLVEVQPAAACVAGIEEDVARGNGVGERMRHPLRDLDVRRDRENRIQVGTDRRKAGLVDRVQIDVAAIEIR